MEKLINKAKKYLGIELKQATDKYVTVESIEDPEHTFLVFDYPLNSTLSKTNEWWLFWDFHGFYVPANKPVFAKRWACIEQIDNWYFGSISFVIFKSYDPRMQELAADEDEDDFFFLSDMVNKVKPQKTRLKI